MPKPKPITPSPLSDPKEWKWCKDEGCKRFHSSTYGDNEQEVMREKASWCAVFGENYCWKHLSEEAKSMYPAKIEKYVKLHHPLDGANLCEVELEQADLEKATLKGANLYEAKLQGAKLWEAKLQEAILIDANLQGAELWYAKLQETDLLDAKLQGAELCEAELQEAILIDAKLQGTYLQNAKLQKARLQNAELQEAKLWRAKLQEAKLSGTNFHNADLSEAELNGAFLYAVELDGAKELTWKQLRKQENGKWVGKARVGEENEKNWHGASDAYRRLKDYFHQQGLYDDESKAYYREKLMAKKEEHEKLFGESTSKGIKRFGKNYASFFSPNENKGVRRHWLGLWFMWAVAGFGERWMRTIAWAVATFTFFGLLYWWGTNAGWAPLFGKAGQIKHLLNCLYFSLVTFVTLGFGDIWPAAWLAKIFVGAEVVMGYVFLGMIVVLIARKFGR